MKNKLIMLLLMLTVTSCSTKKDIIRSSDQACSILPYGTYKQRLTVTFNNHSISFNGLLKYTKESTTIYAFSFFGTTVFKLKKEKDKPLDIEIYEEQLAKYQNKVTDIYSIIDNILNSKICLNNNDNNYSNSFMLNGQKLDIIFNKFDKNKIPAETIIKNNNYQLKIEVIDYEI